MTFVLLGILVFLSMGAPAAWAQQPSSSFSALPQVLKADQRLNVRDAAGRATRGFLVSISDEDIVITPEGIHEGDRRFTRDNVDRIDIVDSEWNGALIGAAVGLGSALFSFADESDCLAVFVALFLVPRSGLLSATELT